MHLFLSPHYDDAVLSCGATIHHLTAAGETVMVITVMGGKPDRIPDTPLIHELHTRWNAGDDPVGARMKEDDDALAVLGAQVQRLVVWTDCIYRTSRSGQALYQTVEAIFSDKIPAGDRAAKWLPTIFFPLAASAQTLYAPMGAGNHVDHQIVRNWALELKKQNPQIALKFYEEYPYSEDKAAVGKASTFFSSHKPVLRLQAETVTVEEAGIAAKVKAIACYKSQISSFWDSSAAMETAVRGAMRDADSGALVEHYWAMIDR